MSDNVPVHLKARLEGKLAKDKNPEELKADLDAKMSRAAESRETILKHTQDDAAHEVSKAKEKGREASNKGSARSDTSEPGPTPTKGKEIPRE